VGAIVVACPPGHAHELAGGELVVVDGGETRAQSVANALEAVEDEVVAIHDAARPLLTPELIESTIATLAADPNAAGAIAATPVTDTIKQAEARQTEARQAEAPGTPGRNALGGDNDHKALHRVGSTLNRALLWAAQTPQVFRIEALREALEAGPEQIATATDEAMIVEAAGGRVLIHPSPPENLKVTTPLDLRLAEMLLGERSAQ
jgi:2-C-methyl-D-erythritol 4-phosphate cytidylyltransferase